MYSLKYTSLQKSVKKKKRKKNKLKEINIFIQKVFIKLIKNKSKGIYKAFKRFIF